MFGLIKFCEENFNLVDDYYIKISGSSRSLSKEKLVAAAEYGVYQIDMGAQTFDDNLRRMLNLPDSAEHVKDEIRFARKHWTLRMHRHNVHYSRTDAGKLD